MHIETFMLAGNGWVPNNARLPVVLYRNVLGGEGSALAEAFEALFEGHGWPPDWRDGIFDYHHYHSTAHEVLGVFAGEATLELGGSGGKRVAVTAGDAVMLPTGTGHRAFEASDDFQVVGAYPEGQTWDICREATDEAAQARMHALPDPRRDPVTGEAGAMTGFFRC
jgi:uncharacterized protein YjlB